MKKVLILGAGLVVKPIVEFLLGNNYRVSLADKFIAKAEALIQGHPNGLAIAWDAEDVNALVEMISEHDIVVSLLPFAYHVKVAKLCIEGKKNMVTTSYVKPEMQALDDEARKAGILILNEIGLDPGIDHMSAMRIIDKVHNRNGKIEELYSICGALPAPEFADNPFRYKFSWSPKGVIMAANNDAKYLKNGKKIFVMTEDLFRDVFSIDFPGVGELCVYPNRDSIHYINIYQIPEVNTMFRGTFRYRGWCKSMNAVKDLGLIGCDTLDLRNASYADMVAKLIDEDNSDNIKEKVARYLQLDVEAHGIKALEWLGLLDQKIINCTEEAPFEVTSDLMIDKMWLGKEDEDMVALQHYVLAKYPDGKSEVIKSRMLDFGSPIKDTAISRTVTLPAAIAVKMILEGVISMTGVHRPVHHEIYNPVLNELEKVGIKIIDEYNLPESNLIQ